ncbi:MAG TPA: GNAT family N-acetyltransferase [Streptosporangiaceae bacterium]
MGARRAAGIGRRGSPAGRRGGPDRPVYTPPALRGHGYGGAATAAVSQAALDHRQQVVLFADLANRTSNALYQRLGFVPVEDRVGLTFHDAGSPA